MNLANFSLKRRTLLLIGASYLAILLALSLIDFKDGMDPGLSNELTNAGHFPAFFVACGLAVIILAAFFERRVSIIAALTGAIVLAALIEIIQPYFGRSRSLRDLELGSAGAAAAAVWMWFWFNRASFKYWRSILSMFSAFTFLLGVTLALPLYYEFNAIRIRAQRFPILSDFSYESELRLWRTNFEDDYGNRSSLITFGRDDRGHSGVSVNTIAGRYSGVSYAAGDKDWSEYQTLELEIFNKESTHDLSFRIDDDGNTSEFIDRFNKTIALEKGHQLIEIPIAEIQAGSGGRPLNLHKIRRLMIFVPPLAKGSEFVITRARLK